ncbi:hypothetical protein DL762_001716 [Monosporascus cannonballus]|uniref:Intradiol ring-cleavage dioxygenases domain-containing protein n=1 Tax=Monosporascus cannonballus TaxID=155416 RepID=A0ABY0HJL5_9PEZI|nr:hypothetical protein DL762_001716 [Monosporascus cannonballus]
MVNLRSSVIASLASSSLLGAVLAHPGEDSSAEEIKREAARHSEAHTKAHRSLGRCANSPQALALKARSIARRAATAHALRAARGLPDGPVASRRKRDEESLAKWSQVSHDHSDEDYTLDTSMDTLFGSNATCALVPESILGPYWVSGERVRSNITDGEPGVPMYLDLQFVDTATCEPIPGLLVDVWHSNALGVYSGVGRSGQGGLETTFGRGVQVTDSDGVAAFSSIFPGHYYMRTPHVHVMSTEGATELPYAYGEGTPTHIGQLYFDQGLINAVERTTPYNTNRNELTPNDEDVLIASAATEAADPFLDYVRLGEDLADGLLLWTAVGVDRTADYSEQAQPAAYYTGSGDDENDTEDDEGGGGSPSPSNAGPQEQPAEPTPSSGGNRLRILF